MAPMPVTNITMAWNISVISHPQWTKGILSLNIPKGI